MKLRRRMRLLIALWALAFAGYASAQSGTPYKGIYDGWYAGASIGQTSVDLNEAELENSLNANGIAHTPISINDTDTGWKLYMGYRFLPYFALEGAYVALGEVSAETTATAVNGIQIPAQTVKAKVEANDTVYLAAVGILPFGDRFAVFGKIGFYSTETDAVACVSALGCINEKERDENWMYGLGIDFYFTRQWGMRAEWERFTNVGSAKNCCADPSGTEDVDFISVGVIYRF
jgi:OOP family OmpA-OmpF porin